ncbi:MAG TPA: deoxyguanosinetriphosphate triphosphohydrolase [Xanthobacteraceae bacterium]|jgi:dGTPase|nr:deoxyguanosinetriphosphate triphosphohydrolase [Xanthobacteraceae bacterium]
MHAATPHVPYACDPQKSRGRLHVEPESRTRSAFRRDCDRIIHSTAFRRLKHKTQVFVFDEGDHYRTRLTHTLEVTQVARALARRLRLDEDLAEALSLAHDLGHPPFGHAGERALDACMSDFGGFDHNAQTLHIVTALERRYPRFDGLNLTWETLEGLVKHNGPLVGRNGAPLERYRAHGVPGTILNYSRRQDLQLWSYASVEAQIAAVADDIAYDAHDIDDGLRAGLFTFDEIEAVPLPGQIISDVRAIYPELDEDHLAHELIRQLIGFLIDDVVTETSRRLASLAPKSPDDVRGAAAPVVGLSPAVAEGDGVIKSFLEKRMYRHARVMQVMDQAALVLRDLFARYRAHPDDLPEEWTQGFAALDEASRARRIADFIAGMTDRFALAEHQRLFDVTPELR